MGECRHDRDLRNMTEPYHGITNRPRLSARLAAEHDGRFGRNRAAHQTSHHVLHYGRTIPYSIVAAADFPSSSHRCDPQQAEAKTRETFIANMLCEARTAS